MAKKPKRQLSPIEERLNNWVALHLTRVSHVERMLFLDHLRIMVHSGLSIVESLHVLGKEIANKRFQLVIIEIKQDIEKGVQLSEALGRHEKIFPSMYVKMIQAGETAGQLENALEQVVLQMKKGYQLASSVRGAMIYPAVILVAMGGIGIMMVTFVLPQLTSLFKEFDAELPLATRVLIAISDFLSQPLYLGLVLGIIAALIVAFVSALRRSPSFRAKVHAFNLHIPIAGGIIKQINLARFSLTLSSLLKSAIPVVEAVNITADTCSNLQYQIALHKTSEEIQKGTPTSKVLAEYDTLFPPMVVEMVMVGERSGAVDELLQEIANFYGDEVDKTMKNFTTIIEPVIIVSIGLAVAGLAVAVVMPMYTLVQNF